MGHDQFDALTRTWREARSRRGVLTSASGGLVTLLTVALGGQPVIAHTKRDKHVAAAKHKHKKKHKKQPTQSVPPPTASPPPPPPPPPTGPGFCGFAVAAVVGLGGQRRLAQTFLPPRSGQLTAAQILLATNPASFSLTVEIRTVDTAGAPTSTILASTVVSGIPATDAAQGVVRPLSAVFATPAPITFGQPFALTITANITDYIVLANGGGNPCPDGTLFADADASGNFEMVFGEGADLVYAVTIV